jgi:hypothetical protein
MTVRLSKVIRGFTEGARLDWLHPSHGPMPDFAAEYRYEEDLFQVLAWEDGDSWISMVCGPDWCHGGYPMSFRWWRGDQGLWCNAGKGKVYDVETHDLSSLLHQVSAASVHVHIDSEPWPEGWE